MINEYSGLIKQNNMMDAMETFLRWKHSTELNPDPILKLRVRLKLFVCGARESKSRKHVGIT